MKDRLLVTRYARALLAALPDAAAAAAADDFLRSLAAAIAASADLRDVLLNPRVSRAARKAVFRALADRFGASRELRSFLFVIVDHGRAGELASIAEAFHEHREAEAGVVPVEITTAAPLASDLEGRAVAALERLTGKRIRLRRAVDATLLGGAVARVGSRIYDGSLRTQLRTLRRRMGEE